MYGSSLSPSLSPALSPLDESLYIAYFRVSSFDYIVCFCLSIESSYLVSIVALLLATYLISHVVNWSSSGSTSLAIKWLTPITVTDKSDTLCRTKCLPKALSWLNWDIAFTPLVQRP